MCLAEWLNFFLVLGDQDRVYNLSNCNLDWKLMESGMVFSGYIHVSTQEIGGRNRKPPSD